jgi:hypothetical protein
MQSQVQSLALADIFDHVGMMGEGSKVQAMGYLLVSWGEECLFSNFRDDWSVREAVLTQRPCDNELGITPSEYATYIHECPSGQALST